METIFKSVSLQLFLYTHEVGYCKIDATFTFTDVSVGVKFGASKSEIEKKVMENIKSSFQGDFDLVSWLSIKQQKCLKLLITNILRKLL